MHSIWSNDHCYGHPGTKNPNYPMEQHVVFDDENAEEVNPETIMTTSEHRSSEEKTGSVMLLIATVNVRNPTNPSKVVMVRLFFDCGAQRSFVTQALVDELELEPTDQHELLLSTFAADGPKQVKTAFVRLGVALKDGTEFILRLRTLPNMTGHMRRRAVAPADMVFLKTLRPDHIANGLPTQDEVVLPSILLGSDYMWEFFETAAPIRCPSGLFLIPTTLGLLFGGQRDVKYLKCPLPTSSVTCLATDAADEQAVVLTDDDTTIKHFFDLETIGVVDSPTADEDAMVQKMFDDTVQYENKRYYVTFPWKLDRSVLPDNYGLCIGRLRSVLTRLSRDPELLKRYHEKIADQLKQGIVEVVDERSAVGESTYYVPHHPVITPPKLRLVYDASATTRAEHRSLNDCLHKGDIASFLPDLIGLLLRFRTTRFVLCSDVEAAFLQVGLQECDRDMVRFLWLKDHEKPFSRDNLQILRFCRVPFGVNASPWLLGATLKHHLRQVDTPTARHILANTYVDNVFGMVESEAAAIAFHEEATCIFSEASMRLRDWLCNSDEVNARFAEADRATNRKQAKILGLKWNAETDFLTIALSTGQGQESGALYRRQNVTKRRLLAVMASCYDPMGLIGPVVLLMKLLFQQLWCGPVPFGWDEQLPPDIQDKWNNILIDWHYNSKFHISRPYAQEWMDNSYSLHTFVDASANVYACCIYLRIHSASGVQSQLVFAKNRLAPKKAKLSIPVLELMAVLIGVRCTKFITAQLRLPIQDRTVWSDSMCALYWLKLDKQWTIFIRNRVKQIKEEPDLTFRYVRTSENSADINTRGCKAANFSDCQLWWHGPPWLTNAPDTWPVIDPATTAAIESQFAAEVQKLESVTVAEVTDSDPTLPNFLQLINSSRVSSFPALQRIMAYCLHFLKLRVWNRLSAETRSSLKEKTSALIRLDDNGALTANNVLVATFTIHRSLQHEHFHDVFIALRSDTSHHLIDQLGVVIDQFGLLRCGGRLAHADLSNDTKFPILLPARANITKLVILQSHLTSLHAGVATTLAQTRQSYWILRGRRAVRETIKGCLVCRKFSAPPYKLPLMPALPTSRVQESRPFRHVGLDYMGPIFVKNLSGDRQKAWVCLFSCLCTRAIHLEYVTSLSAESFLACLRRFVARRAFPTSIYCDNASQFTLVKQTLDLVWSTLSTDADVVAYFARSGITWRTITPFAPFQAGVYERQVSLIKSAFRKSVGKRCLSSESFSTLLCEIEAALNSRPISYISDDFASRFNVLRPIDFLIPFGSIGMPSLEDDHDDPEYLPVLDSRQKLLRAWRKSLTHVDRFWELWRSDYLLSLREKWSMTHHGPNRQSSSTPVIGEIVLLGQEGPRGTWPLAKIIDLKTSPDGAVRSARILLPSGTEVLRSVSLLYPLEVTEGKEGSEHRVDDATNVNDDVRNDERQLEGEKTAPREGQSPSVAAQEPSRGIKGQEIGPIAGRTRARTINLTPILYSTTIFVMLLNFLIVTTQAHEGLNEGDRHYCPQVELETVQAQTCISSGLAIMRMKSGGLLCWLKRECANKKEHLNKDGECEKRCTIPDWAEECSYYDGPSLATVGKQADILQLAEPSICSLKAGNPTCSDKPTHVSLNQVQLFDNSLYFVKNLELIREEATKDEFECVGTGNTIGTPAYCSIHPCEATGRKFCYFKHYEKVYLVSSAGRLPIKCWGSVPSTIYGPKDLAAESALCLTCSIECGKAGVEIQLDENIGYVEVCALPYCVSLNRPRRKEMVPLPKEVVIKSHEVTIRIYSNGVLVKSMGRQCPVSAYCDQIDCWFCVLMISNPQCSPTAFWLVLFALCYFSAITVFIALRLVKCLFHGTFFCGWVMYQCLRIGRRCCKKTKRSANDYIYLPILRSWYESADRENDAMRDIERASVRNFNRLTLKRELYVTIIFCTTILYSIGMSGACSVTTTLTAKEEMCMASANNTLICKFRDTTRIALTPMGQTSCLLLTDAKGAPIGTIHMAVTYVRLICEKKTEFFSRSFEMKHKAVKRCPTAGSCVGEKCAAIKSDTMVTELEGEANKSPGYTFCSESSSCISSGCFFCTSACLFWRIYAVPTSDTVFEVFSCTAWRYSVQMAISIETQAEKETHSLEFNPGIRQTWKELRMTVVSVTSPPAPILNSLFVTDRKHTAAFTTASTAGTPIVASYGDLQCSTRDHATAFNCYFPIQQCTCQARDEQVGCQCSGNSWEALIHRPFYQLPMSTQGINLFPDGDSVEATYNDIANLEMQLSFDGLRLVTKISNNKCEIIPISFSGCYNCPTASKLIFKCLTSFGEALAHVRCGDASFSTKCSAQGVEGTTTMAFEKAKIVLSCVVSCPASETTFNLEGTLMFVPNERLRDASDLISAIKEAKGGIGAIDVDFIFSWLRQHWWKQVIVAIAVTAVILLSVIFFPIIAQGFIICLIKVMAQSCKVLRRTGFPRKSREKTTARVTSPDSRALLWDPDNEAKRK